MALVIQLPLPLDYTQFRISSLADLITPKTDKNDLLRVIDDILQAMNRNGTS